MPEKSAQQARPGFQQANRLTLSVLLKRVAFEKKNRQPKRSFGQMQTLGSQML